MTHYWMFCLNIILVLRYLACYLRNSIQQIFKFLDEETNFREDIKIMIGMPPLKFMRALIKFF